MAESETKPSFTEMSAATRLTVAFLSKFAPGQIASYEAISAACHIDVRKKRWPLNSATRFLVRTQNMVFAPVRSVGLKRLDDSSIVDEGSRRIHSIGRAAGRVTRIMATPDISALPPATKARAFAVSAIAQALRSGCRETSVKKLEGIAVTTTAALTVQDTLKAFGG